jgi:hypothetical protein
MEAILSVCNKLQTILHRYSLMIDARSRRSLIDQATRLSPVRRFNRENLPRFPYLQLNNNTFVHKQKRILTDSTAMTDTNNHLSGRCNPKKQKTEKLLSAFHGTNISQYIAPKHALYERL